MIEDLSHDIRFTFRALRWNPGFTIVSVLSLALGIGVNLSIVNSAPEPTVYVPLAQRYNMTMNLEVRAIGNPDDIVVLIRRELAALDKDMPLLDIRTLKAHFDRALSQERLSAFLLTCLGSLALVLSAIGIHGVLSYSVARRTREIGVRIALGAETRTVIADILGDVLGLVGAGLAVGILTSLLLTRLVTKLLYGLSPTDPFVFCGSALVLFLVALGAGLMPAIRIARINPSDALRCE